MKNFIRERKGITLIALVITVIVMLILAGVALSVLVNGDGLFTKTRQVAQDYEQKANEEVQQISDLSQKIDEYLNVKNNGVNPKDVFDINGKSEDEEGYDDTKLHLGDFINYDAGTWTASEIASIRTGITGMETVANGSTEEPTEDYQFGGFAEGTSRNLDVYGHISGWRLFDIDEETGEITIISAGCPENFNYIMGTPEKVYQAEYILTGDINENAVNLNLDTTYTKRNYSNYETINGAKATLLDLYRLEEWFDKYVDKNLDLTQSSSVSLIHNTKYKSLIERFEGEESLKFYSRSYWLARTETGTNNKVAEPYDYGRISTYDSWIVFHDEGSRGIRILITLPVGTQISSERVATKQITDTDGNTYTYNVWDLEV